MARVEPIMRPASPDGRPPAVRVLLAVQALCFLGAALQHARDIWQGGWLPYPFVPLAVNGFWTALVFLDPLAAALLLIRPRAGVVLALLIMLTDVGVNSYVKYGLELYDWRGDVSLQLQT